MRVYSTETWRPVGAPLAGHVLTVTRVAFSPDDRYVLTVSRDRSWRLFEAAKGDEGGEWSLKAFFIVTLSRLPSCSKISSLFFSWIGYVPVAADKSHGRIIWDCAWSQEGDVFATASRDKTVRAILSISSCIYVHHASSHHLFCRSKSGQK